MKKIGICGHFNTNRDAIGGQTLKTRILEKTLRDLNYESSITKIDSADWKANPLKFLIDCIKLSSKSKDIILLPAHNGVKIFIPLFVFLGFFFRFNLHYVVIGGWLPKILKKNRLLLTFVSKVNYIYVETSILEKNLKELGLNNIYRMPNFKSGDKTTKDKSKDNYSFKMCIFSRINSYKGIETAINTVERLIKENYNVTLDLYGPIEKEFSEKFKELLELKNPHINYRGIIDSDRSVKVLEDYNLLLFPTKYYTEGFPGTILDAYLSGVPVLVSRWESWSDIVVEGVTGISYEFNNDEDFYDKLKYLLNHKSLVSEMGTKCLEKAAQYKPENAIKVLLKNLK